MLDWLIKFTAEFSVGYAKYLWGIFVACVFMGIVFAAIGVASHVLEVVVTYTGRVLSRLWRKLSDWTSMGW